MSTEAAVVDRFIVSGGNPAIDILMVVDISCWMVEEQPSLAMNLPVTLDSMVSSGVDWHVGVISTAFWLFRTKTTRRGEISPWPLFQTNKRAFGWNTNGRRA